VTNPSCAAEPLKRGAEVAVRLATLGPDGPTGAVFEDETRLAW